MKFKWDNKYFQWGVTAFGVIAASMLFYYGIFHMKSLISGITTFLRIVAPIIYGLIIAYVLNPVVDFLENTVIYPILKKKNMQVNEKGERIIRWICVLSSLVFLIVVIYTLVMMILPQLIRSIMNIIYSFPYYVKVIEKWLNSFVERGWDMNEETIDMLNQYSSEAQSYLTNKILPQMQEMLKNVSMGVFDVLIFLKNFLIGGIISIYVMADKEIFIAKSKMVIYAIMPGNWASSVIHSMRFTHQAFGGFISGKILDSAIIGVLCYIGTTLLDMPYAILVSVIVGVTNVIPFFGPYIGAVPSGLLILLVNPMKGLYFVIFILILQQFDGNILGPKILGESTGLSSFMVIVAILIGGGLFGIPGLIAGVPVCAVIYAALWNLIGKSLDDKNLPDELKDYTEIDCLDEETGQALPMPAPVNKKNKDHTEDRSHSFLWRVLEFLQKTGHIVFEKSKALFLQAKEKWEKEHKKDDTEEHK